MVIYSWRKVNQEEEWRGGVWLMINSTVPGCWMQSNRKTENEALAVAVDYWYPFSDLDSIKKEIF